MSYPSRSGRLPAGDTFCTLRVGNKITTIFQNGKEICKKNLRILGKSLALRRQSPPRFP